jgi:hypothetical protein
MKRKKIALLQITFNVSITYLEAFLDSMLAEAAGNSSNWLLG